MEKCAVPAIIGRDALTFLNANINYRDEVVDFSTLKGSFALQLMNKDSIIEQLGESPSAPVYAALENCDWAILDVLSDDEEVKRKDQN